MNIIIHEDFTAAAAAQARATKNVPAAVRYILQGWASDTVKLIKSDFTRYLNVRSGLLRRSVGKKIVRKGETSEATVGTNVVGKDFDVPYARIQDEGGWIVPRKARALTIPLAGTKGRVSDYGSFGKGGNLFIIRTATGNGIVAERTGKTGRTWKARFLLVKSVKIQPSYWFSKPYAEARADLTDRFDPLAVLAVAAQRDVETAANKGE